MIVADAKACSRNRVARPQSLGKVSLRMRRVLCKFASLAERLCILPATLLLVAGPDDVRIIEVANADPAPSSFRACPECPEMVVIPAGSFMAGPRPLERDLAQPQSLLPQRRITIARPFAIGKYEVTWGEYEHCVKDGACASFHGDNPSSRSMVSNKAAHYPRDHPMIGITVADMERYAEWLTKKTGRRYRLPSSMEWEYAARAGTDTIYPWGDTFGKNDALIKDTTLYRPDSAPGIGTFKVGLLAPNRWGLHDVIGNVSEVTGDCIDTRSEPLKQTERIPDDGRPLLAPGCANHLVKGGSAFSRKSDVSTYKFEAIVKGAASFSTGFRIVSEQNY